MVSKIKNQIEEIVQGYKLNIPFRKSQLDIIVQLPSFHSYISINLYYPNNIKLIDKVLPLTTELLSKEFPMITIASSSYNYIEIILVSTKSYAEIYTSITHVKNKIQERYPNTRFY